MNVARTLATAALLLLPLLAFGTPATSFTPSSAISGVFLRTGANGPTLGFGPVTDGEGSEIPLQTAAPPAAGAPPFCVRIPAQNAGQCLGAVLGIATSPTTFTINGTGAFQLWLSTTSPAPIVLESLTAKLLHVQADGNVTDVYFFKGDLAARSETGGDPATSSTLTLTDAPSRIAMASQRATPTIVFAGETLTLSVEVFTPVSGPDPLKVVAHYGPDMPSGVLFQLHGHAPPSIRLGTTTLPIYATGTNVTFHPISNATDQARTFPVGDPAPPATVVEGSTITFGPTPLDESAQLAGDGFVVFTVATAPTATGPSLGLAVDVTLQIGEKTFTTVTNLATHLPSSEGTTLAAPLRVTPGQVIAGENVTLSITLYAPKADNLILVFGSSEHPTGVHLPVVGGGRVGPPPPPAPAPREEPPAEPEPSEPAEPEPSNEPAASQDPSPTPEDPDPSPSPSPSDVAAPDDDGTLKEAPPKNTPSAGFALLAGALAALAIGLRGRLGKGS